MSVSISTGISYIYLPTSEGLVRRPHDGAVFNYIIYLQISTIYPIFAGWWLGLLTPSVYLCISLFVMYVCTCRLDQAVI